MRRPLANCCLIFILIILVLSLIRSDNYPDLSAYDGQITTFSGILDKKEYKSKDDIITPVYYLKVSEIGNILLPSRGKIICYLDSDCDCPLGSTLTIHGKLHTFHPATNTGQFDSRKYYETMRIYLSASNADVISCDTRTSSNNILYKLLNRLFKFKSDIAKLIELCMSESDSGIVKTLLLSDKSSLSPECKSLFTDNGVGHILVVSGLHISLLGMSFYTFFNKIKLPRFISCFISIILMIFYGILTGLAVPAFRAVIMFTMRMLADVFHRQFDMLTGVMVSATILVIDQPLYLFYSGFQFSFGAIIAVIYISPLLDYFFPKLVTTALSINIITFPIYLYNYYYFPFLSIPLNLIIIPLMSILMILILTALAFCAIYIPLGKLIAIPVHLILSFFKLLCKLSGAFFYFKSVFGKPSVFQIILYFLLLSLIIIIKKHFTTISFILSLMLCGIILTTHINFSDEMILFDVGQGDCIYITDNHGTNILVDGGSSSVNEVGKNIILPALMANGVDTIDAVFITHMDFDHYSGIRELIMMQTDSPLRIEKIIFTGSTVYENSEEYRELISLTKENNIPIYEISQGDYYKKGKLKLRCLYPDNDNVHRSSNEESMVLLWENTNADILLTGDIEKQGEDDLIDFLSTGTINDNLILKVAHHGSRFSTSDNLLSIINPDIALISAGRNNKYGHPHTETIERLENHIPSPCIHRTDESGQITIKFNNDTVIIEKFITYD